MLNKDRVLVWFGEEIDPTVLNNHILSAGYTESRVLSSPKSIDLSEAERLCPTDEEIEADIASLSTWEKRQLTMYIEAIKSLRWLKAHYN